MKKLDIVREANIGTSIELTNVELVIIKTKWNQITSHLSKMKRLDEKLVLDITHFSSLMDKIIGEDISSIKEAASELFSIEENSDDILNDNDFYNIVRASTGSYDDNETI